MQNSMKDDGMNSSMFFAFENNKKKRRKSLSVAFPQSNV